MGQYRLEEEIGAGAHGNIHKAYDTKLGRTVALKSLKRGNDAAHKKTLLQEARSLARLNHNNIVTLYDVIEDQDDAYIVMEYVDGVSLAERLKGGPLPVAEVIGVAEKLADALAMSSEMGVVHGDIKPGNIMLDQSGAPRLVDFGLAKLSDRTNALATLSATGDASTSLEGTLPYMAPESVMGGATDERADIFSLGAVLYELTTGKRAFDAPNQGAVLNCVLNETPVSLSALRPETPRWFANLIDRMLQKDPEARMHSMAEVRVQLAARGKRDWRSVASDIGQRLLRFARKKRSAPQWAKAAFAVTVIVLVAWSVTIIRNEVAPPVSVQMAEGIDLIRNFEKKGAVKKAQDVFGRILSDDHEHAAAQAGLALALIREYTSMETDPATLRRATAYADAALEDDPHLALANIAAGWAAEFNSDFERAHALYDAAELLDPNNALVFEGRARTLKKQGDYDGAIAVLEQAIEVYPKEAIFYGGYGEVLLRKGLYLQAETVYRQAIELYPDGVFGHASLAQALHLQGKTVDAIAIIQDGLKIEKNAELYNNLGTYLFFQGRYAQSVDAFERTLEFEGNTHQFLYWANLADAYRWAPGQRTESIKAYRRAIQLLQIDLHKRPDHGALQSRNALYSAKMGDMETAAASLKKVLDNDKLPPVQLYRAAVTLEILGDRHGALQMLERTLNAGYAFTEIANDPELKMLRQDKFYQQLINRKGLAHG